MGGREYLLLALVILIPLVIAVAVTLWSLEQVRYRPKRVRRWAAPTPAAPDDTAPRNDPAAPPPATTA